MPGIKNPNVNPPPILSAPPLVIAPSVINYELTRWDLFVNSMTVILRNRLVQIIISLAIGINGALVLLPQIGKASAVQLGLTAVGLVIGIIFIVLFFQSITAFAIAFLMKQNGVVGNHTLSITDAGLVESTAFNDTLHKWPSILRIMSLFGYIYIYVGEQNSHQIPRRSLTPEILEDFLTKLRTHCPQLNH